MLFPDVRVGLNLMGRCHAIEIPSLGYHWLTVVLCYDTIWLLVYYHMPSFENHPLTLQ